MSIKYFIEVYTQPYVCIASDKSGLLTSDRIYYAFVGYASTRAVNMSVPS